MQVEFAFLCDAAQDSGGKLHALGIGIDRIVAAEVPVTHPMLAVVAQMRYTAAEAGRKPLAIRVLDADGGAVIPAIDREIEFGEPSGAPTGMARLVLQIGGLRFERYGAYAIQVAVAGTEVASLPLEVIAPPPAS